MSLNTYLGEYLVVWSGDHYTMANGDREVWGQRVRTNGTLHGVASRQSDIGPEGDSAYAVQNPAVAYSTSAIGSWLIVWSGDNNEQGVVLGESEIWGQFAGPVSDLQVSKSASRAEVLPGQQLVYTLNYTNPGPDPIVGVRVTDTLPAQYTGPSCQTNRPITLLGGTYAWDAGALLAGEAGTIIITGNADGSLRAGARFSNTVLISATSAYGDVAPTNNAATVGVLVVEPALVISKTLISPSGAVDAYDMVRYRLEVQHTPASSAHAYSLNVTDDLSPLLTGTSILFATVTDGAVTTNVASALSINGSGDLITIGTINLLRNTNGSSHQKLTIVVEARVADAASPAAVIANTAGCTWQNALGNRLAHYTASSSAPEIHVPAQWSVSKAANTAQVTIGDVLTYTVMLTLTEGTTANVYLTDTLPAGLAYVAGSAQVANPNGMTVNGFSATPSGQQLVLHMSSVVNPGNVDDPTVVDTDAFVISYRAQVQNDLTHCYLGATLTNDLDATANNLPADTNNSASVTVVLPDLVLTKRVTPSSALPGGWITYVVAFSNTGNLLATGVVLTDSVPSGATVLDVQSSGVALGQTSGSPNYAWDAADMGPGARGWVTITMQVNNGMTAGTALVNTAGIRGTRVEADASNNAAWSSASVLNAQPVAVSDGASGDEDVPLTIPALANDSDANGDNLSIASLGSPSHGVATLHLDDSVRYTPTANYNGYDQFTYTISDGQGGSASATVYITLTATNDDPTARDDSATTPEDTPVTVSVLDNDSDVDTGDTLSLASVDAPQHGQTQQVGNTVRYTPTADYHGNDDFAYSISDGHGGTASATVYVTVTSVNDCPVALDDGAVTPEDTPVQLFVLDNDGDVDLQTLTVTLASDPTHGLAGSDGRTIYYTPTQDYSGYDSLDYALSDGQCAVNARVYLTVTAMNDCPVAQDDSAITPEDTPVRVWVLTNDTDADGDVLTVTLAGGPAHGLAGSDSRTIYYTPPADYSGLDEITYRISDGQCAADAVVYLTVTAVNDCPVAVDDGAETPEDTPVRVWVLDNDTDADSDVLTVTLASGPAHGLAASDTRTVYYTPTANYHGLDELVCQITDGQCTVTAQCT